MPQKATAKTYWFPAGKGKLLTVPRGDSKSEPWQSREVSTWGMGTRGFDGGSLARRL